MSDRTASSVGYPLGVIRHSRHFDGLPTTSGLPPETDIVTAGRHISKVLPTEDIGRYLSDLVASGGQLGLTDMAN